MKLTELALKKLNARDGAGSRVTPDEYNKRQITIVTDEKSVLFDVVPQEAIFRGSVKDAGESAKRQFRLFRGATNIGQITPNLIFPKPKKGELRIYLSEEGFMPPAGSIWYIFITNHGELALGFCSSEEFDSLQRGRPIVVNLRPDDADLKTWPKGSISQRIERTIKARRGQTLFRNNLLKIYDFRCCVTGSTLVPILEAAHIEILRGADNNNPENGLLLRSDVHTLFDLGLLKIQPDLLTVELAEQIMNSEYNYLHNKNLEIPKTFVTRLNINGLRMRYQS